MKVLVVYLCLVFIVIVYDHAAFTEVITEIWQHLTGQKKQEPSNYQTGCEQSARVTESISCDVHNIHCSLKSELTIYRFSSLGFSPEFMPLLGTVGNDY